MKNREFLNGFTKMLGKNGENFNAKQGEHANGECENSQAHGECETRSEILHSHDNTENLHDHADNSHEINEISHTKNLHESKFLHNHAHAERENENFKGLSCENHAKNSHSHDHANDYETQNHDHSKCGHSHNENLHGDHKQHAKCNHDHAHTSNKKVLKISFFIIFLFMVVEVIGGFVTNSLALLSDATHMLSDALALALALLAFKIGEKNGTLRHTFGYKRVEILVAFLNSITLLAIAVWIVFEAISRFKNPPEIATFGMLAVSFVGLLVNLVVAFYMLKNANVSENVNLKGAYLHVLSDLLGSAGAVVAGLLMIFFNLFIADAIVSVLVAILVAKSGWGLLKATFHILMEGSPVNVNSDEILTAILGVNGVKSIHDLHIWSISSGINALCAHVVVDSTLSIKEGQDIIKGIENALKKLNITHQTIQLETAKNGCDDRLICDLKGDSNGHLGHNH